MADTIILRVDLQNEKNVVDGLSRIDALASQLRSKTITINVKGNADSVSRSVLQLAKAQAQAETAAARRASAEAKVAAAQARSEAAASRAAQQETKLTAQRERATAAANKAAAATDKLGQSMKTLNASGKSGLGLLGQIGNRMKYIAANAVLTGVINSFKDAVSTMKDVDTALVTIQKTAGASTAEMKRFSESAYSTASKYGVSATEYLESVAEFTRAGYFDIADQLGELAIKTQLVGDTTAEVADKFLLAVNAAWKYDGNITKLSAAVDKADAINNNYATSLDKIAAGMPIVANVAATANMSIEETIAMLGTITAVTQESGTKAATAARALILNIMGDTATEIEDGVTLTSEQINDLSDILWKYSRDAMEAAQATGKIVDPMEAIAGLAKASQEGLLTEQELARIASDIGGKLRTNQLLALINNWDMFNDQLETMQSAAGTADSEIGIMLDSWDAKTKQISNSWTELVSSLADTDTIKGALDVVNGMLTVMNDSMKSPFDSFGSQVDDTEKQISSLEEEIRLYENMAAEGEGLTAIDQTRLQIAKERLAVLEAEKKATIEAKWDSYNTTFVNLRGDTQADKDIEGYTEAVRELFDQFGRDANLNALRTGLQELNREYIEGADNLTQMKEDGYAMTEAQQAFYRTWTQTTEALQTGGDATTQALALLSSYWEGMGASADAAAILAQQDVEKITQSLNDVPEETTPNVSVSGVDEAIEKVSALAGLLSKLRGVGYALSIGSWITSGAIAANSSANGTESAPGGPTLVNERGPELIYANGLAWIAGGGEPTVTYLPRGAGVLTASQTRRAMNGLNGMGAIPSYAGGTGASANNGSDGYLFTDNTGTSWYIGDGGWITSAPQPEQTYTQEQRISEAEREAWRQRDRARAQRKMEELVGIAEDAAASATEAADETQNIASSYGGGGGGTGAAAVDLKTAQKELDDALKNLKDRAKLADNRGEHGLEGELYGEAQERVRALLAQYRAAGYEETSDEIVKLENLLFDYADQQEKAYAHVWDELEKGLDGTLKNLKAQIELAENRGDYGERDRLLGQARGEIEELLKKYREAGFSETSDEVLRLENLLFDYAEQQEEARQAVWNAMEDGLDAALKTINAKLEKAENENDIPAKMALYTEAQDRIADLINAYLEAGYAPDSDEILRLTNLGYDYAGKQTGLRDSLYKDLIDALDGLKNSTDEANALAEKRQALDEAREKYDNASRQRTVRIFNPVTGQWEWIANAKDVQAAQERLLSAEKSLKDAEWEQMIRDAKSGETSLSELIAGAPVAAAYDEADMSARSAFLNAMQAYTGSAGYEAGAAAQSLWSQSDSHDTNIIINGMEITPDDPAYTTLQMLAQQLSVLKLT